MPFLLLTSSFACFSRSQRQNHKTTGVRMQCLLKCASVCMQVCLCVCVGARVHTRTCGWDRFGNRRYLSRDRGVREEERETDNENQGEVMLARGEEDRDQK